jgi:hypothetical protein
MVVEKMRQERRWLWVIFLLLAVLLFSCSGEQSSEVDQSVRTSESLILPTSTRPAQTAFKGKELYSWQSGESEWLFSVMNRTNRHKTIEEVQVNAMDIEGVMQSFCEMAIGENVIWLHEAMNNSSGDFVKLPSPPQGLASKLEEQAAQCEIRLVILNW